MNKEVVGFKLHPVGLSNQTIALLGLICYAKNHRCAISFPRFVNLSTSYLNPQEAVVSDVAIEEVSEIEPLMLMLKELSVEVALDRPIDKYVTSLEMFKLGYDADLASRFNVGGMSASYWNSLRPNSAVSQIIKKIELDAFGGKGIQAVVQLRLEPDMKRYHELKAGTSARPIPISYQQILSKVKDIFGESVGRILLSCDESQIPFQEVKSYASKELNFDVIVKSNIIGNEVKIENYLLRSIVDFYLAVKSDKFVGAKYSTFSSAVYSSKIAATSRRVWSHYAYDYNYSSKKAFEHRPQQPSNQPVALPDVSVMSGAKYQPLRLLVHVANRGDVIGEFGWIYSFGKGREIEGFSLEAKACTQFNITYRARLADKTWTEWASSANYVGTRGQSEALTGFSVRCLGRKTASNKICLVGKFSSGRVSVSSEGKEDCTSTEINDRLSGMQIILHPWW